MSETQISSLQLIATSEIGDTTAPVVIKASDDNEKKESPPKSIAQKSKLIPMTSKFIPIKMRNVYFY